MSSWIDVYFPEFRGATNQVRSMSIPSEFCLPTVESGDIGSIVKRKQGYAFVTGPKDSNCTYIYDSLSPLAIKSRAAR